LIKPIRKTLLSKFSKPFKNHPFMITKFTTKSPPKNKNHWPFLPYLHVIYIYKRNPHLFINGIGSHWNHVSMVVIYHVWPTISWNH
jgi:hypothetical protein